MKAIVVASPGLFLRAGPGTNYPAIGSLPKGTIVTMLSQENGWAYVQPPTGPMGFVCSSCPATPGGPWLQTLTPTVSMRAPQALRSIPKPLQQRPFTVGHEQSLLESCLQLLRS